MHVDSFDEANNIGASCAVVGVGAESDCSTTVCRVGGIDAQGSLTARTANNVKGGFGRSGSARGERADAVIALIGFGEMGHFDWFGTRGTQGMKW